MGPAVERVLDGLDTCAGPVVDVGAGTGESTAVAARALPAADILAVEPHPALRTALLTRITGDSSLRGRVTVMDSDILSASLPERISGLIAMNVIGHLAPPERQALWASLAHKLAPHGRAVLNLQPPTRPEAVPRTLMSEVTVGHRTYTGWAEAEPEGDDAVIWHLTYRVVEHDHTLAEFTASDRWYVLTAEELAAELGPHGLRLTCTASDHGLQLITHQDGTNEVLASQR